MNFVGTGVRLADDDFARAASAIGCEVAAIKAVTQVEARGQGFDAKNRPILLTEGHVFYRNLSGAALKTAINQNLAWEKWTPGRYPKTQDDRYAVLNRMCMIDETAALKAASYGLGQVLGENFKACGFATPQEFVARNLQGEGGQLDVMVAFILSKGLGIKLRNRDWAGFAYGYNGASFKQNEYDTKLARAYALLSASTSPAAKPYDPLADGMLSMGDKGDAVKALQIALGSDADGDFGAMTQQAVVAFQTEHGLTADGKVGKMTGKLLGLPYWG